MLILKIIYKKTYLIANTKKLKKIYKKRIIQNLKQLIF